MAPFVERLVEVELFDRAVAIASQAFVALIPYMVVVSAVLPSYERHTFADSIIHRFDLTGDSAEAIEHVFAPPGERPGDAQRIRGRAAGDLGAELLPRDAAPVREVLAAAGAGHALERQPPHMARRWPPSTCRSARRSTRRRASGSGPRAGSWSAFALSFLVWLWTPYLLLGRRVERRALRWTAALTATGMTAFSVASIFYMPQSIAASAERFGMIGIAIAIVSWLIGVGFVLVVAAAFGGALGQLSPDPYAPAGPSPPARAAARGPAGRGAAVANRRTAGRRTSPPPRARRHAGERERRAQARLHEAEAARGERDLREHLRGAERQQHEPRPRHRVERP